MSKHDKTDEPTDLTDASDVEVTSSAAELGTTTAAPQHGFFIRLYTGTGAFDVVGKRKLWYAVSGVIVGICVISMLIRGFTFGIDFEGGTAPEVPELDLGWPVVAKPSRSSAYTHVSFPGKRKVFEIADRAQLLDLVGELAITMNRHRGAALRVP